MICDKIRVRNCLVSGLQFISAHEESGASAPRGPNPQLDFPNSPRLGVCSQARIFSPRHETRLGVPHLQFLLPHKTAVDLVLGCVFGIIPE